MDLTVVYSKTAKGLRARSSLIGGLSSQLMKVLLHVDGTSKVETILFKYDEMTEQGLATALIQLEAEGYIKPVLSTRPGADEWSPATIFAPMEVEEVVSVEEAEAQAAEQARLQAEYKAKIKEEVRLQIEQKAQEKEELEYAKEKAKAEVKIKAQLEKERITREAEETQKKADEETRAKAEEKARLEAEHKAKIEQEALQKAELKALEAAEQARARVQAEAEEKVRREIERIAQEAEAARIKFEQEAQAKAEKEAILEAERQAKAKEEARLQAEFEAQKAAEQARAKAQAEAEEKARRNIERIALEAEAAKEKLEAEEKAKAEEARLEAELKTKADAQLEAERTAKAEEATRLEVERKAREEDDARLKTEIEAKAKAEKIRAKAEAEEKTKTEEKERARLDIARIVREAEQARKNSEAEAREARLNAKQKEMAAEEQKKAEIEAITKTKLANKLEAERKIKAEDDARLEAESKAKVELEQNRASVEAKEIASTDANLKASLAMQSFALNTEEERQQSVTKISAKAKQAKLQAELKVRAEQEASKVRAKFEADEKALAEEKEIARQEIERIGREAEQERQKQHLQASAAAPVIASAVSGDDAIEVKWANPDDDEEFAEEERIASEVEKVGLEIKKKTKRVAEVEGRQEIIRAAQEDAHVKAKSKVESKTLVLAKNLGKWAGVLRKVLLIYLPPAILLVLVLLHFINISALVEPVEKLATESLGIPVKIEEVRASLWPRPHLVLKNITIGANSAQKIEALNIVPVTSSLSEEVKILKSIEIKGLKIEQENFGQPLQWISSLSKAQYLKVGQITLNKLTLKIKDLELAPFNGKVALTESRELKSIDLMTNDETLAMQITPQGSSFAIAFSGTNWALPMNPKLVFSELKAKGIIKQSLLFFNEIEGAIYGGRLTGKAALDWSNQWSIAGNFNLVNANLPEMLNAFGSSASVDGKFKLAGIFSCQSKLAAALTDAPEISANFTVQNGKINGVELDRAVLSKSSQSLAGDSTRFDKLTGNVKIKNRGYHYRQLVLKSDQFYAEGNVDIKPNQDISGNINANLAAESRRLQARFDLAGKVNNVKRQ